MGTRLYLGNLAYHTTVEDLQAAFNGAGVPTTRIIIPQDRMTGQPQGTAVVDVADEAMVQKAIDALHNTSLNGKTMVVQSLQERNASGTGATSTGGRGGGRGTRS